MKGIKLIFAVCLALLGVGDVWAIESDDAVRAASRRGTTNTITSTRQKSDTPNTSSSTSANTRITNATNKRPQTIRERTATPRTNTNVSTVSRVATRNTSPRNTTGTQTRATTNVSNVSRTSVRTPTTTKSRTQSTTRTGLSRASIARSTTEATKSLRNEIMNANTKECREIYYNCMDEFCANKDSQLKRCACSSRLNEFDGVKKQLANAEEKMLDFSQRLLTVSMDAKDAAALNVATEGELAFNQKDTSQSKKLLDEITKKLNTKFSDDSFDRNLTAISLSLNEDAAFDNVDSLMGASTTLKTGTALYGAALPVCREMAAEVCTPEQLSVVEGGYQMLIEQDCNTVKKSYQSQTDSARAKILENSALLDMSRLSTYQDKNSDDILTCKRKMLDMLSDTAVCGTNLSKCLDTTGQYIDPTTGEAFLTENLANLSKLIIRPSANQTWVDMPANDAFVKHLNSKKKFLEPAMAHCQNISDSVWSDFIEDALAQIKLAQDAKLEQVRQSCTTLTVQCMTNTAKSLEDFDARALSTFGISADKTVNAMCSDVKNACTALMKTTGDGQEDWTTGMTEIATDTTYNKIIQTCREIGRACIIQACKSISGNFGLCENINTSINRQAILSRTSCWDEVLNCVKDAGEESIERIISQLVSRKTISSEPSAPAYSFYAELYSDTNSIHDICRTDKCNNTNSTQCKTCRIAERIWGNCEQEPSASLSGDSASNRILQPKDNETTLLYWFALNTGTENLDDSCRAGGCGPGEALGTDGKCYSSSMIADDGLFCATNDKIQVDKDIYNCCQSGHKDKWGNCCGNGKSISVPTTDGYYLNQDINSNDTAKICVPNTATHVITYKEGNQTNWLVCMGNIAEPETVSTENNFPSGNTITCSGTYMIVTEEGVYYTPSGQDSPTVSYSYKDAKNDTTHTCTYTSKISGYEPSPDNTDCTISTSQYDYIIKF